jgi:preprotein translocase SecE subunit
MLSIYKPDQGYWTRLLSALGFGALIAWGAMWVWDELGAVDVPDVGHRMILDAPAEGLETGDQVALYDTDATRIGEASIKLKEGENALILDSFAFRSADETGTATSFTPLTVAIVAPRDANIRVNEAVAYEVEQRQGIDAFERVYLQGGVAIGIILLGAIGVLYFCYVNRKTVDFLIATEGEMKKVNWTNRRQVIGSTWVVIGISVIIAAILLVADIAFSEMFRAIGLLES